MDDQHRITTVEQLRSLYREPSAIAAVKDRHEIDDATRRFVERARFAVVGTYGSDGSSDTSPRGGPSGFIRVLDAHHLAIADLGGNNRLDSLRNVVDTGRVALLVVVPGRTETVRVDGEAWISTDPELLASFGLPRLPRTAIVVRVVTTFVHCAKAFIRGAMWDPEAWPELADAPDGAEILVCQRAVDLDVAGSRARLDESYAESLAAER